MAILILILTSIAISITVAIIVMPLLIANAIVSPPLTIYIDDTAFLSLITATILRA